MGSARRTLVARALLLGLVIGASAERMPAAIRLAPKPRGDVADRRARSQPIVPSNHTEMPCIETASEPALTPEEKHRGYVLFQRPIMEPVYPNTRPLAQERLERLVAFVTPGEFEPLTLGLCPVRDLQNLKVRCSSLTCEAGAIPAADGARCAQERRPLEAVAGPLAPYRR